MIGCLILVFLLARQTLHHPVSSRLEIWGRTADGIPHLSHNHGRDTQRGNQFRPSLMVLVDLDIAGVASA